MCLLHFQQKSFVAYPLKRDVAKEHSPGISTTLQPSSVRSSCMGVAMETPTDSQLRRNVNLDVCQVCILRCSVLNIEIRWHYIKNAHYAKYTLRHHTRFRHHTHFRHHTLQSCSAAGSFWGISCVRSKCPSVHFSPQMTLVWLDKLHALSSFRYLNLH